MVPHGPEKTLYLKTFHAVFKQAQKVIFSRKFSKTLHLPFFNNTIVTQINCQKHLGMILNSKPNCNQHLEKICGKVNRGICVIR